MNFFRRRWISQQPGSTRDIRLLGQVELRTARPTRTHRFSGTSECLSGFLSCDVFPSLFFQSPAAYTWRCVPRHLRISYPLIYFLSRGHTPTRAIENKGKEKHVGATRRNTANGLREESPASRGGVRRNPRAGEELSMYPFTSRAGRMDSGTWHDDE